jgi:hypothetical protein
MMGRESLVTTLVAYLFGWRGESVSCVRIGSEFDRRSVTR